jgi:hypothetical protein
MSSYVPPTSARETIAKVMTSQHATEAGMFAKNTAADVQRNLNEGDWSLRFMALLAGLAMMGVSAFGFVGKILTFHWVSAVFKIYVFALGVFIVILESGKRMDIEQRIYATAPFLK